jgi:hypothetical protein
VLLALDGLLPPEKGAVVSFHDGRPKVSDGPFAEAKEVIGGYWIIQVKSRDEAIEWAKRVRPDRSTPTSRSSSARSPMRRTSPPTCRPSSSGAPSGGWR